MILALRTDRPETELYLLSVKGDIVARKIYRADRRLANSLLVQIEALLKEAGFAIKDIRGVAYFSGEGSFTGLRIGASVANALAYSLGVKVVSVEGEQWLSGTTAALRNAKAGHYPAPVYDRKPNIS